MTVCRADKAYTDSRIKFITISEDEAESTTKDIAARTTRNVTITLDMFFADILIDVDLVTTSTPRLYHYYTPDTNKSAYMFILPHTKHC